jgi:PBP1b-binding outer membrane lipoprotein LpoB
MKKQLIYLSILSAILFSSSCYYDNKEELYPNTFGGTSTCDTTNQKYSTGINTLINNNCATAGCHVTGATSPDLSSYQKVKDNITRVKVRAIDQKTMPAAGPLSVCDINKLTAWINAGMPQ